MHPTFNTQMVNGDTENMQTPLRKSLSMSGIRTGDLAVLHPPSTVLPLLSRAHTLSRTNLEFCQVLSDLDSSLSIHCLFISVHDVSYQTHATSDLLFSVIISYADTKSAPAVLCSAISCLFSKLLSTQYLLYLGSIRPH